MSINAAKQIHERTVRDHEEWGEIQVYRVNSSRQGKVFQVYLSPEFCKKAKLEVGDHADIRMIGGNIVVAAGQTPAMMTTKSLHRGLPHQAEGTVGFRMSEQEVIDRGLLRYIDKARGSHFTTVSMDFFRDSKVFTVRQTK